MRTSRTHPLQIAEVRASESHGVIGITFCPGKQQKAAHTGDWVRDLAIDLDAIAAWNAAVVVTLVEEHELASLCVTALGEGVRERHMVWHQRAAPDAGAALIPADRSCESLPGPCRHHDRPPKSNGIRGRMGTIYEQYE